ncbi:MAG: tRNA threonylcarbamoyladenosine dehydratase [Bacilli bacterium]|nr:tRNA threonylcarbamoyladenosine dehydratase [Bacilli bacterium]
MQQLERFELLVGKEKLNKISDITVLIIGLGGVGSYAVESLVRCGIKKIIIVDKDVIDITNLNRQLMTLHSNIGHNKVDVIESRIKDINENIQIKKINEFINKENINLLFEEKIDYLIDACDTIETKKEIIRQCVNNNIKLISCMGTGKRLDPSKLKITELKKTSYDPIAKILRKMVRDEKIKQKITVICSEEQPINTNSKIIPSNSFVPASAGLLCTGYIINDILKEE